MKGLLNHPKQPISSIRYISCRQWRREPAVCIITHLWEFFCLLCIFCSLNSWLQGLILKNGRRAKGAACKLTWSQTTTDAIALSQNLSIACIYFVILAETREDLPLLWTSAVWRASAWALWEEEGDPVHQPQRVKGLFLGWHFLSSYPAFWLPDGNRTSVGCRGSVCQKKNKKTCRHRRKY